MRQKTSNYEKMKNEMALSFAGHDQKRMIQKFSLDADETYLYLPFFGCRYRIDRGSGAVQGSGDGFRTHWDADYNEAMTIYDVLCNAKDGCCPSGEFVSINSLSAIQGGSMARNGGIFQQTAESFQGKTEELRRACRAMGGSEVGGGDVGFRLELFRSLDLVIRYWDGDEEFPASMQILVDRNILDYMHYETVMFALSHVLDRLREGVYFSD